MQKSLQYQKQAFAFGSLRANKAVLVWKERFNTVGVLKKYLNTTRVKLVNTKKKCVTATGHNISWDHFEILASGKTDYHCKIKETLFI